MSYPPDPNNPYGQQAPQQPGYGYPQQGVPPQGVPPQPGYGYPQQPPVDPYAQQAAYGQQQAPYGYPQDPYNNAAYVQNSYAGWGSRVVAYIVDGLIAGLVPLVLYIIGIAAFAGTVHTTTDANGYPVTTTSGGGLVIVFMLLAFVIGIGTSLWLCHQEGTTGQTPGKKMVNIRLVREADGQPIGFGMAVVRKLCHLIDGFVCYLGYLWPLWDAKKQTFADKIMTTVVVKSQ